MVEAATRARMRGLGRIAHRMTDRARSLVPEVVRGEASVARLLAEADLARQQEDSPEAREVGRPDKNRWPLGKKCRSERHRVGDPPLLRPESRQRRRGTLLAVARVHSRHCGSPEGSMVKNRSTVTVSVFVVALASALAARASSGHPPSPIAQFWGGG